MPYAGRAGNLRFRKESSIGESSADWKAIRPEDVPTVPSNDVELVENHVAGHRNLFDYEKGKPVQKVREEAISFATRIRRGVGAEIPSVLQFFQAAGWNLRTSTASTVTTSATTTSFPAAADVGDLGQCILIHDSTSGNYRPALLINSTSPFQPSMEVPNAPSDGAVIGIMHTVSPTTLTAYEIPADQALQFMWSTLATDTSGLDLSMKSVACAAASLSDVEFGDVGTFPTFEFSFHAVPEDNIGSDVIQPEDFMDEPAFAVMNSAFEFAFADADGSAPIALNNENIMSATVNFGIGCVPIMNQGNGGVGGISGYMMVPTRPTITVNTHFSNRADFDAS